MSSMLTRSEQIEFLSSCKERSSLKNLGSSRAIASKTSIEDNSDAIMHANNTEKSSDDLGCESDTERSSDDLGCENSFGEECLDDFALAHGLHEMSCDCNNEESVAKRSKLFLLVSIRHRPDMDCLIIDTEAITFGLGGSRKAKFSCTIFLEVALIHAWTCGTRSGCEIVSHSLLDFDLVNTIKALSTKYQIAEDVFWTTIRFGRKFGGCRNFNRGSNVTQVVNHVKEKIKEYSNANIWAKGPALERRFLGGYVDTPVVIKKVNLPWVNNLETIGCPKFDDMTNDLRARSWKHVPIDHSASFHPFSKKPHCCAVECVAMGYWAIDEWRKQCS